ncbi:EAL domain-containing protein [Metapseudomonas otitidis]|uniref:EAL domain-containing protein n=1 Tax=Metapseudomonas otitidis TaxID=319939 RepID=UPI0013F680E4|nr:EAL domain-containing protein [Pseudomonas otitidis]
MQMPHPLPDTPTRLVTTRATDFTEAALRSALLTGEGLRVVVQPQFNLGTGKIVGAEALVRWRYQEHDVSPDRFLPTLAQLGLERELFEFVLDQVQDLLLTLTLFDIQCAVSVNASAVVLSSADMPHCLEARLLKSGLPAHLLNIEVTEDNPAPDLEALAIQLSGLRERGIGISMDDFGVGCSSMKRLVTLPFSELKIDRMFIQEMANCPASSAVVQTSLSLGSKLGMQVVAEGVETSEQAIMLRDMGCSRAQGFGLSVPLEIGSFIGHLVRNLNHKMADKISAMVLHKSTPFPSPGLYELHAPMMESS